MRRVLVIDDEQVIRNLMVEILVDGGYDVVGVATADAAFEALRDRDRDRDIELVVSDIVMPGLSGLELLGRVREEWPSLPIILVTAAGTQDNLREALERGAHGLITKPFSHKELVAVASAALDRADRAEHDLRERLLRPSLASALANAIEARDPSLSGHCERLAALAVRIAERVGLSPADVEAVRLGAVLHDVGKIGIPDRILLKAGKFTDEETALMRTHPLVGDRLLKPLELLESVRPVVRSHHERWDGAGYPDGLEGAEIALAARIVSIADAMEAMSVERTYQPARGVPEILAELEAGKGTQWDPSLVELVVDLIVSGELFFTSDGLGLAVTGARVPVEKSSHAVLLVGRDQDEANVVRAAVEAALGRVVFAHAPDVASALGLCRGATWSLVLLDGSLRDRRAPDLVAALRTSHSYVPIVHLIGERSKHVAHEAFTPGDSDYVIKSPTYAGELTERVRTLLA